jgi:serine protease AprX
MATRNIPINEARARSQNPFIHVPFAAGDLSGIEITGGGTTEFVPVTSAYRRQLLAGLDTAQRELDTGFQLYPDIPGIVLFRLREIAIAKSHRPLTLAAEAGMPPAGHGRTDEMLVAANPVSLTHLRSLIRSRNTKQIRANLSALQTIAAWDAGQRLPLSLRVLEPGIVDVRLRESGRLMLRLFRHRDDHVTLRAVERLERLLRQFNVRWRPLSQRTGPPVFIVDADSTLSREAVDILLGFPGLRSLAPEPQAGVAPMMSVPVAGEAHRVLPIPPDDSPVVAVFDTGVHPNATILSSWVASTETFVTDIDTDYVHGTSVASLIADAWGLNDRHEWLAPAGCRIHDVCALESGSGSIGDLIDRLRIAVANRPDIRVWNLSLGSPDGITGEAFTEFAQELDSLSDQYQVLFVVAAGNYTQIPRRGWPCHEALADRLSSPADSVRALSVGALVHLANDASFATVGAPACYSRRGPGPVFTPKPDIVHIGGGIDSPWTAATSGIKVLTPGDAIVRTAGTSFAAPIAAAMAAHTWRALGVDERQHGLALTPNLVKALMIHAAEIASPDRGPFERRYFGSGLPIDPLSVLYDRDDSFTLVFEADLAANSKWRKAPYPIPAPLIADGKLRAEVIVTAAYAPPLDPNSGAEYVRANVEIGFGLLTPNAQGALQFRGRVPLEGEPGTTGYEKAQVEHGGKWSPVKVMRRKFPVGVKGTHWALQASMMRRALEPPMAEPLRVVMIVTLRSLTAQADVYEEGTRALARVNWITQSLPVGIPIHLSAAR